MTTHDFITALFCQVDDQLPAIPKHPEAHLWPSEIVTLGLLHAALCDIIPRRGEPYDHGGVYHGVVLRGR